MKRTFRDNLRGLHDLQIFFPAVILALAMLSLPSCTFIEQQGNANSSCLKHFIYTGDQIAACQRGVGIAAGIAGQQQAVSLSTDVNALVSAAEINCSIAYSTLLQVLACRDGVHHFRDEMMKTL